MAHRRAIKHPNECCGCCPLIAPVTLVAFCTLLLIFPFAYIGKNYVQMILCAAIVTQYWLILFWRSKRVPLTFGLLVSQTISALLYLGQAVGYCMNEGITDIIEKYCSWLHIFEEKDGIVEDLTSRLEDNCVSFFESKYWIAIAVYLGQIVLLKAVFIYLLYQYYLEKKELADEPLKAQRHLREQANLFVESDGAELEIERALSVNTALLPDDKCDTENKVADSNAPTTSINESDQHADISE